MSDIYNAHTHIFTGNCAPKDFLQVGLKMGDGGSRLLKWLFMTRPVSWIINNSSGLITNKQLQFLKIGVMSTQAEVLKELFRNYEGSAYSNIKIISLSIDMDYMTDPRNKPLQDFNAQVAEVVKLKKTYPDRLFPFYGIDPRNPETLHPQKLKDYISSGVFAGIKLYPAKGFFPFDERMDAVYKFASENNVPVMTHCTRSGSYFIGKDVWPLIPAEPSTLNPGSPAMNGIRQRIAAYKSSSNKEHRENKRACNLFTHPENYIPVLEKYPRLRLCLAHLGGVTEILGHDNPDAKERNQFKEMLALEGGANSYYEIIRDRVLREYPNTFSDISYSLSSKEAMHKVAKDIGSGLLNSDRILFGTDYFMVQQENSELNVVNVAQQAFGNVFNQMMSANVKRYLFT